MGMNFYLEKKIDFINNLETPASLGCGYEENQVQELTNGFVWQNTYYSTIEELCGLIRSNAKNLTRS